MNWMSNMFLYWQANTEFAYITKNRKITPNHILIGDTDKDIHRVICGKIRDVDTIIINRSYSQKFKHHTRVNCI